MDASTTTHQASAQNSEVKRYGIRIKRDGENYDALLFGEDATGKLHKVAGKLVFEPVSDAGMISHDMRMKKEDAEHLMQDLWEAGIRPEGWDLEKRRFDDLQAAKKEHFDDIRDIAKKLADAISRK